jgi:hypothetical protein
MRPKRARFPVKQVELYELIGRIVRCSLVDFQVEFVKVVKMRFKRIARPVGFQLVAKRAAKEERVDRRRGRGVKMPKRVACQWSA